MKKKTQHLVSVIAFMGFIFIAFGSGDDKKEIENKIIQKNEVVDGNSGTLKKENWNYSEGEDKMEGTKQFFASCISINEIEFEFPYNGGSSLSIIIRNLGNKNEALLTISKGQFMTSVVDSESFKVKFDDEKSTTFYFNSASDGSSDVVFITNSKSFLNKIKQSKKVMIEVPFFNEGSKVFEFNVEGLNWNK